MSNNIYLNITTAATNIVSKSQVCLEAIVINKATTGSITVYDNSLASGTKVATIAANTPAQTLCYDCELKNGLTIVNGSAEDITVIYG